MKTAQFLAELPVNLVQRTNLQRGHKQHCCRFGICKLQKKFLLAMKIYSKAKWAMAQDTIRDMQQKQNTYQAQVATKLQSLGLRQYTTIRRMANPQTYSSTKGSTYATTAKRHHKQLLNDQVTTKLGKHIMATETFYKVEMN